MVASLTAELIAIHLWLFFMKMVLMSVRVEHEPCRRQPGV